MKKTEHKTFQTLDLYLSSYIKLNGIPLQLELNNGKVIFVFQVSDDLYKLIANYNSNQPIAVTDFVTTVKMLRGQMLSMRGQR